MKSQPPPLKTAMIDNRHCATHPWATWFGGLTNDESRYKRGTMADKPSLGKDDKGFIFEAVDYRRTFEWQVLRGMVDTAGTTVVWVSGDYFEPGMVGKTVHIQGPGYLVATYVSPTVITLSTSAGTHSGYEYGVQFWRYAAGEREEREIAILPIAPIAGWHLCDGTTVTATNSDGTTQSFALPNLVGSYPKGAASVGSVIANVNPTIVAVAASAGTPTGTVSLSSGSSINGGAGAPQSVVDGASFSGNPLPTHTHTVSVTAPGEPQHIGVPFYCKL